ncbi:SRPBCC domain-containing protein [Arthrobacter sp. UYCu712]|uniref:SRPBCC family protein n=1 Tax=Arthrobacter sp. UYCu712 TaxID=3156340 RepID=UPI0033957D9E
MTEPTGSAVTRTFAVPPEAVFDAWVTPESFAAWWGGSDVEIPLSRLSLDVRPGGAWKATMILSQDQPSLLMHGEFHMRGEYIEVDRPNRLVLTMTNEPHGDERELLTVTFNAVDGGTEMVFSQTGGHLTSAEYVGTTVGWQNAFNALDTILKG